MRTCTKCHVAKPVTEFYVRKERNGYDSDCKDCGRATARAWHARNRERSRASSAAWKAANPTKLDATTRRVRLRAYGLTPECYAQMLDIQQSCCGICGKPASEEKKRLAVDHCHVTGAVRALLCQNCNKALGGFQDSPHLLRVAAKYLEHFRE